MQSDQVDKRNNPDFRYSLFFGLALTCLFAVLHLLRLTHHGLWVDEFHTVGAITKPFGELAQDRLSAGHIPTYFVLLRSWCLWVGFSEWSIRLPSVAAASLAFFAFFLMCRDNIQERNWFLTSLGLFFFNPFLLWASQEARMYSALIFISVLSSHFLLRMVKTRKRSAIIGYSCCLLAGFILHLVFSFLIVGHILFLYIYRREYFLKSLISIIIPFLLALPLIGLTLGTTENTYSVGFELHKPSVKDTATAMSALIGTSFERYGMFEKKSLNKVSEKTGLVFFLVLLVLIFRRHRRRFGKSCSDKNSEGETDPELLFLKFCYFWIAVPACLFFVSQIFNFGKADTARYYLPSLGGMSVIAAWVVVGREKSRWLAWVRWGYLAFFVFALVNQIAWKGPGAKEGLELIREAYRENDCVLFCGTGSVRDVLPLYKFENIDYLFLPKKEMDESKLLDQIREFTRGRQRVWVFSLWSKKSPAPDLLDKNRKEFSIFEKEILNETEIKGYTILGQNN